MASSSHDNVFVVMERPSLGNHAGSSRDHHLRARSMSALQENEVSWILVVLQLSSDCMRRTLVQRQS